jgi:hypothetical protein
VLVGMLQEGQHSGPSLTADSGRHLWGIHTGMSRAGERAFGVAAIVAGVGIVVATAAGMSLLRSSWLSSRSSLSGGSSITGLSSGNELPDELSGRLSLSDGL